MQKLFVIIFLATQTLGFSVHALETKNSSTTPETQQFYNDCKKNALERRENLMVPARKEYLLHSQSITDKAKKDFDKIKWIMTSAYLSRSKTIQENKEQAMIPVNEKITQVRNIAFSTWKAESALCDVQLSLSQTQEKALAKK